ncbi:MAG: sensor histidine kinase [Alphaproteobacteria bacterium]|nr:sensor histidine kinase [Alphaproteobacteria bacterium]
MNPEPTGLGFGRLSLRVILLLILAVALSPVLVIGGIQWTSDMRRQVERRQVLMSLVAEEAADRAELVLSTAPALLDVVDAVAPADPCAAGFIDLIDRFPQFNDLTVINADGVAICSAQAAASGVSVQRVWFDELRTSGAASIQSTAYRAEGEEGWMLAVAKRRETPAGDFNGAWVIGVPLPALAFSLDRSGLPRDSEIALLDGSGRMFSSRHWTMLDPSILASLKAGGGGFFEAKTEAGGIRQLAIVDLSPSPLYAVLSAPRPAPIALENVNAFGNFALPLLAWFLALVTAWLATDRLVLRWLDYLRRIAGLYASGKLSVQPIRARQAAPIEITVLADTLEDMAVKVRDRTQRLEHALAARDAAMKEIHHRVKNNLQIINSLLSLQSRKVKDPAALAVLDDARGRISALSLIHRSLYEHNDIRSVHVKHFFEDLVSQLDQALGAEDLKVRIEAKIDDQTIDADLAVPLALFTSEAVTNAIKHAFPDARPGRVLVSYRVTDTETLLSIEDDGIGAANKMHGGLGSTLMSAFARQARGTLEDETLAAGGHVVRIRMPHLSGAVPVASGT